MFKSLATIKVISAYLREKGLIADHLSDIKDLYGFFTHLQNHKNKFYALYIYNYLFNFISRAEVAKRKGGARIFEDLLAIIFNGKLADTKIRKNLN